MFELMLVKFKIFQNWPSLIQITTIREKWATTREKWARFTDLIGQFRKILDPD